MAVKDLQATFHIRPSCFSSHRTGRKFPRLVPFLRRGLVKPQFSLSGFRGRMNAKARGTARGPSQAQDVVFKGVEVKTQVGSLEGAK